MLFFIRLIKSHVWQIALGTGLGFCTLAAGTGLMALAAWFLTSAALAGLDPATAHLFNFFLPSIGVRVLAFARTAARYGERLASHDATFAILASLRTWFYRQIEPLAPGVLGRYRHGDILARIGSDIDALDNLYIRVLSPAAVALAVAVTIGALLGFMDGRIAATALASYLLAGACALGAGIAGWPTGRRLVGDGAALRIAVVEGVRAMAEILVFDGRQAFIDRFGQLQQTLIAHQGRLRLAGAAAQAAMVALAGIGLTGVLYIGAGRVGNAGLSGAMLALAALTVWAGFDAFYPLAEALIFSGHTGEAGRRIMAMAASRPAVAFPLAGACVPGRFELTMEHIDFAYGPGEAAVFKDFSLTVGQGAKIAIVGPSGCGKSTLVHLLLRFADPQHGVIRIGGTPIDTLAETDLRNLLGVLDQQGHLFGATVRDNLLLARADADDRDLAAAIEAVDLGELIRSLAHGLDTWIGEGGKTLSGGQARRLALARVILKDAPIWILDEPFEALDRATAASVMANVLERCAGRSLILITHRDIGLDRMDTVIRLDRPAAN